MSTHIELLSRERTRSDASSVSLDDTNHVTNLFRWNPETSADSSDTGWRGGNEGICAEVQIKHESICALDQDALLLLQSLVEESWPIDDIWFQSSSELLVTLDLALCVVSGKLLPVSGCQLTSQN